MGIATESINSIITLINKGNIVSEERVYRVYDPVSFINIINTHKGKSVIGLTYGGIQAKDGGDDSGASSTLSVNVFISADSKLRDSRGQVSDNEITALCDSLRDLIKGKRSSTGNKWNHNFELPLELNTKLMVYYQSYSTDVLV